MKSFWKTVFATAVGYLLLSVVVGMLSIALVGGIAAGLGGSAVVTSVPEGCVLDINFENTVISEQTLQSDPFSGMSFSLGGAQMEEIRTVGILDAVKALEAAANDPSVKFVYLRPDAAVGIAHLEEFRNALVKFHECGKPIIAFIQSPTNAGYYLASAADRIYVSDYHGGMNMMVGISGQMVFFKDLLDKLGVKVQLIRHGKYKSAGEGYVRNSPSPENLEQNTVMIKGLWKELAGPMAARAGKTVGEFNALIDNLSLVTADDFVSNSLADEAVSLDEMKERLCAQAGVTDFDDVKSISLADYASLKVRNNYKAKDRIAVVYADGGIVDGRGLEEVAGKRFSDIIDDVRRDEAVKAVVLRVNSPGGSVIASSQIKEAVDALRKVKPVIASYGEYAASGGYWISACTDYIFSDATTLTGSIGVFGMLPDLSSTYKNLLHVNKVSVNSNRHSDMYRCMRPLDSEETAFVQKDIETIYSDFTTLVANGRKMTVERVDELGQGRVWTGRDALERGLVDRIGGLSDAIEYASVLVSCPDYCLVSYPAPLTPFEQFMQTVRNTEKDPLVKLAKELEESRQAKIYARLPFDVDIR